MTEQPKDGGAALDLTPSQLLAAYDNFWSGRPIDAREEKITKAVGLAGCFAVDAYEKAYDANQGAHVICRVFLQALIDPLHADLDYLRRDPASGAVERAAREATQ